MRIGLLLLVSLFLSTEIFGQEIIPLKNPSFEDNPRAGNPNDRIPIKSWSDCGAKNFPYESPPDIHPDDAWKVDKDASDGKTYLGMVVRDNDSHESVSQRLEATLVGGNCYSFSIDLARSSSYISRSQKTKQEANYTQPAVLRIWGGAGTCNTAELLAESETVKNYDWKTFTFEFEPEQSYRYIVLEAFYKTPTFWSYNGHVLVDNASTIKRIPCDDESQDDIYAAIVDKPKKSNKPKAKPEKKLTKPKKEVSPDITKPENKIAQNNTSDIPRKNTNTTTNKPSEPEASKLLTQLDRNKISKGQKIKIENLFFKADSSNVEEDSYDVLDEIFDFLNENRDIVVEIGGHTNGNRGISHKFCDWLSTNRAKEVSAYLIRKGISPKRIEYRGYGKRKPIATNRTPRGRSLNQRVEIKILNMDS